MRCERREPLRHLRRVPVNVAAYVRVSSAAQDVKTQRASIARAAKARGDVVGAWFVETMSGKSTQRPELTRLRASVRAGEVARLYVYRIDRLTRSGIRDTLDLVDEFTRAGCALVTVADGFDFQGPAGEVVLAVIAWAAKVERLAIGERISAARARVEAEGGSWGRPPRMTPALVAKARARAARGHSVREIAAALKVPRSTVYRVIGARP